MFPYSFVDLIHTHTHTHTLMIHCMYTDTNTRLESAIRWHISLKLLQTVFYEPVFRACNWTLYICVIYINAIIFMHNPIINNPSCLDWKKKKKYVLPQKFSFAGISRKKIGNDSLAGFGFHLYQTWFMAWCRNLHGQSQVNWILFPQELAYNRFIKSLDAVLCALTENAKYACFYSSKCTNKQICILPSVILWIFFGT